jgi:RNA processing factor Prp31
MSEIQRYHTNEYGDLVKSNASYAKLCKYEDVKALERQLEEYKTKEQKRYGASLNELMTWSVKELAELVVDLNDEHEDLERQLERAKQFIWERTGMPMDVIEAKLKEQGK